MVVAARCLLLLAIGCGRNNFDPLPDGALAADGSLDAPAVTYRTTVLADLPVAYWRLGDVVTPTARDEGPSGTTGTYTGGVAVGGPGGIANDPDTAATFGGVNGKVVMGNLFQFTGTSACTFEAWVRPRADGINHFNIMSKIDNSNQRGYLLYVNENFEVVLLRFQNAGAPGDVVLTAPVANTSYNHVVYTYDGVTLRLYVQGVLRDNAPTTQPLAAIVNPLTIGFNESNSCCWFEGEIDEVAIYDYALPPNRIEAHYRLGAGL